jgi:hypothetical protein
LQGSDRFAYVNRLAQRGLKIHSYDGVILTLRYNAALDECLELDREVNERNLILFGSAALHEYPDAAQMFPGMKGITLLCPTASAGAADAEWGLSGDRAE